MSKFGKLSLIIAILAFANGLSPSTPTGLMTAQAAQKGASGLPLPRFVSIKSNRVNMRVGPGRKYQVDWLYTKAGLPLEIIQEFDHWRKVRDSEGTEGWILHSLLSGKRTALVSPWLNEENEVIALRKSPKKDARLIANMQPGVLTEVEHCNSGWCQVRAGKIVGYAEQVQLWGVYPDEAVE